MALIFKEKNQNYFEFSKYESRIDYQNLYDKWTSTLDSNASIYIRILIYPLKMHEYLSKFISD